ncbi:MAG: ABC transporter permease [Phascolarctobacterium sp.]|uniref:ABC transporter permease n=1 Tax=Phascolarctobacterium sp. TaxID=2049039 RepID=UPI0026DC1869|nr:ABC transporter permease [Phascolarctobacterium sp.]MDO4920868.1 ABC transporter permease [Phascolarctobacterium sp.]
MPKKILRGLLLPCLLLAGWQLAVTRQIFSPYLLPAPSTVWQSLGELCASGVLLKHLTVSLRRVALGFTISCCLAVPLGILCGQSKRFENYCWLLLEFLRHVPPLAAVPLIILWAGIGEASKLTIIVLASFFPLFLNTYSGIHGCDKRLLEVGQSLSFTAKEQILQIRIPAALTSIVVGMQLALGYSWRALIGAELIAATAGIGYLILDAEEMSRPDVVIVGMLAIGLIGTLIDYLFLLAIQRLFPWHEGLQK